MAKKVRKDGERKEEKKVVFEPPEFDERQYLVEELGKMRVTVVFLILAVPFGAAGAYLGALTGSGYPGLVVAILGIIVGHLVLKMFLGVDLLAGKKRDLAMAAGVYMLAWLMFSILFSNPPFIDQTTPSISDLRVYVDRMADDQDSSWTLLMLMGSDKDIPDARVVPAKDLPDGFGAHEGDNITIMIRTASPTGIRNVSLTWWIDTPTNQYTDMKPVTGDVWDELGEQPQGMAGEHYYYLTIRGVNSGNMYYKIVVEGKNGETRVFDTTNKYSESVPVL